MKFFNSNDMIYRLLRTIVQGVLAVFIANLDLFIAEISISDVYRPVVVALIMAMLSPIMAVIGDDHE